MAIFLVDGDNQELVLHSALGMAQEPILSRWKIGEGLDSSIMLTGGFNFVSVAGGLHITTAGTIELNVGVEC